MVPVRRPPRDALRGDAPRDRPRRPRVFGSGRPIGTSTTGDGTPDAKTTFSFSHEFFDGGPPRGAPQPDGTPDGAARASRSVRRGKSVDVDHPTLPGVHLVLGVSDADADGARAELWPKLFNAARLLLLFSFLRRFFRGTAGAGGAPAGRRRRRRFDGAAASADGLHNRQSVGMLAEHSAAAAAAAGVHVQRETSEVKRPIDPYEYHVLCALQGAPTEAAAFGGLVAVDAESLHRPEEVEPARPLRVALARAFGRSWLEAAMWLSSWDDAWLLLAVEEDRARLREGRIRRERGEGGSSHETARAPRGGARRARPQRCPQGAR